MTVALRPATRADAYPLWLWANDGEARIASGRRDPIAWAEHVGWLEARLADRGSIVWVAELDGGRPIGTIRFQSSDGWNRARLSYSVAPEARGEGLGRRLLVAGLEALGRETPGVTVEAEVFPENAPSLHLFRSLHWPSRLSERGTWLFTSEPRPAA